MIIANRLKDSIYSIPQYLEGKANSILKSPDKIKKVAFSALYTGASALVQIGGLLLAERVGLCSSKSLLLAPFRNIKPLTGPEKIISLFLIGPLNIYNCILLPIVYEIAFREIIQNDILKTKLGSLANSKRFEWIKDGIVSTGVKITVSVVHFVFTVLFRGNLEKDFLKAKLDVLIVRTRKRLEWIQDYVGHKGIRIAVSSALFSAFLLGNVHSMSREQLIFQLVHTTLFGIGLGIAREEADLFTATSMHGIQRLCLSLAFQARIISA